MVKNFKIKTIRLSVLFIFCFSFLGVLLIKPPIILAQTEEIKTMYFSPQIEMPFSAISGKTEVSSINEDGLVVSDLLARYLKAIYDYGIMIGGILAALMLMAGGLIWLTSGGDSGKVSKAKDIIAGSITGVVLLMGAYFILNTINPDLVEMKGLKMIQIQNISMEYISCCHRDLGEKRIGVFYDENLTAFYLNDPKKGLAFEGCEVDHPGSVQCENGYDCQQLTHTTTMPTSAGPISQKVYEYKCEKPAENPVGEDYKIMTCCHPTDGSVEIKYKEVNNKKYYFDGELSGQEFSDCESIGADLCLTGDSCVQSSQAYLWGTYMCYNPLEELMCCSCERVRSMWSNEALGCQDNLTIKDCELFCKDLATKEGIDLNKIKTLYRYPASLADCNKDGDACALIN
ncbi:hypothetical protein JXK06_00180 [Patescibacteria group bacterium]|nr:hypothetical protein [Patescibacteria group bacterium]